MGLFLKLFFLSNKILSLIKENSYNTTVYIPIFNSNFNINKNDKQLPVPS